MPTQRNEWLCDKCHEDYATKESAQECEGAHLSVEHIETVVYNRESWPLELIVRLSDGRRAGYRYSGSDRLR